MNAIESLHHNYYDFRVHTQNVHKLECVRVCLWVFTSAFPIEVIPLKGDFNRYSEKIALQQMDRQIRARN